MWDRGWIQITDILKFDRAGARTLVAPQLGLWWPPRDEKSYFRAKREKFLPFLCTKNASQGLKFVLSRGARKFFGLFMHEKRKSQENSRFCGPLKM